MNVLITGTSAGLGLGLARACSRDHTVFSISRSPLPPELELPHLQLDFAQRDAVNREILELFLDGVDQLDLVILNAGMLGQIQRLEEQSLEDLDRIFQVNLWANKQLIDGLLGIEGLRVTQVVFVSSGASINGNAGWGGYSLSKAALNMLAKLYASENPEIHFSSLAPGIIDTGMQELLCEHSDAKQFPSLERLIKARGTEAMPNPDVAAERLLAAVGRIRREASGSYLDLRKLN